MLRSALAIRTFQGLRATFARSSSTFESTIESFYFHTEENDPRCHSSKHLGRIYNVPEKFWKRNDVDETVAKNYKFFPSEYLERCHDLDSGAIMIREPALEAIDVIKNVDLKKLDQPLKILFYGKKGHGKSVTLSHLRHFFLNYDDFITVDLSLLKHWYARHYEIGESVYKPGKYDNIGNAHIFLQNFLIYNENKLKELKLHETYNWSLREKSEEGAPLLDVVMQGIERPKNSADCFNVLLKELKLCCQENQCKIAIIVDGVNCIFEEETRADKERLGIRTHITYTWKVKERLLKMDDMSSVLAIRKLLGNDYTNSIIVATVDRELELFLEKGIVRFSARRPWMEREFEMKPDIRPYYPFALLGELGWETMDPFLPIEVPAYSERELDVMIDFYVSKGYTSEITKTDPGRKEIRFITGRNPYDFHKFSVMW